MSEKKLVSFNNFTIVNKIVKDHHGAIKVESQVNVGTKFIFDIPNVE